MPVIRKATGGDIGELVQLLKELFSVEPDLIFV